MYDDNAVDSNFEQDFGPRCPEGRFRGPLAPVSPPWLTEHEGMCVPLPAMQGGGFRCRSETHPSLCSGPQDAARSWTLITSPRFGELLSLMADHGILREDFNKLEMPEGFVADEVWNVLTVIRRAQGIHYRDVVRFRGCAIDSWFTPTHRLARFLRELELRTYAGSRLDVALAERHGRRFIVRTLVDETASILECDGFEVDYEMVRTLIVGDQEPASPVEHLVVNTHGLLNRIINEDFGRITPELLQVLYGELIADIDASSLGAHIPWEDECPNDPIPSAEAIRQICAMASGELADPAEHPIILSQRLIYKFWKTAPYPCCNYIMGSLLSRLYMKQSGYPAFAYVPSSSVVLAWKHGVFARDGIAVYHKSGNITDLDRDWTVYWESCMRLLLAEVRRLEKLALRLKSRDDALLSRLGGDHAFNHRQREVLKRAILVPGTTFRIDAHKRLYDLAYSTARQDLTALVEHGMLNMHYEGKAQVFVGRRELKGILARKYAREGDMG